MAARLINTEETFVLASLKEFVKIWGSGNQASFNLECRNGRAYLKMETHLGTPDQQHFVPPHVPHDGNHQHRKKKSPRQIYRNNARAAAYKLLKKFLYHLVTPCLVNHQILHLLQLLYQWQQLLL